MHLSDLPTPQILIDHRRARRNIDRVQGLADEAGLRLRPHAKTHKSPVVATWQLDRVSALSIIVDDAGVARGWSDAMQRAHRRLDVLIKVDVGFHRCGIDPEK